jgi:hypothetical protein
VFLTAQLSGNQKRFWRIGDQIDAAVILAEANFVNVCPSLHCAFSRLAQCLADA